MSTTQMSKQRGNRQKPTRGVTLDVIAGPLLEISPSLTIQGSTFRIGRTKASKLQIKDETVSEKHGELKWNARKGVWEICDRGSSNGTSVNGEELVEGAWRVVQTGDEVRIGETTVVRLAFWEEEASGKAGVETVEESEREQASGQVKKSDSGDKVTRNGVDEMTRDVKENKRVKRAVEPVHEGVHEPSHDKENAKHVVREEQEDASRVDKRAGAPVTGWKTGEVDKTANITVLEHIEAHCAKLERDLVEQGAEAARRLREAWEGEKKKILEKLNS